MPPLVRKVTLNDIRFFAYHGFYPEEQVTGTVFFVDIETVMPDIPTSADELSQTVNYEELYEIAERQMSIPRKLIETVAEQILADICAKFSSLTEVRVAVKKMALPMKGQVGHASVSLSYTA